MEVEIVEVKRRYATADLVRVLTPSPLRVEPRCSYYMRCAGCQYQHVEYTHQLELKHKQIRDIFQRIGGIPDPPIEPVVASPQPYGYRNKIVVHGPGKPGFWTMRGRSMIAIDHCPIAREEINRELAAISSQPSAVEKHLAIRCNSEGKVWTFTDVRAGETELWEGEAPAGPRPPSIIAETVLGKTLHVPPGSFFQVNRGVIELALEHVRGIFSASGCQTLVDAYCGVGLRLLRGQNGAPVVLHPAPMPTRRHLFDSRSSALGLRQGGAENVARTKAAEDDLHLLRAPHAGKRHQGDAETRLQTGARRPVRHVPADRPLRGRGGTGIAVEG